ncbi:hypothetical protein EDB86DRAFT_2879542 [Lactarius hatsudake]|nr:hypothetical protein EDB86DRAFT_2879542 [Lactarius hatsudake]
MRCRFSMVRLRVSVGAALRVSFGLEPHAIPRELSWLLSCWSPAKSDGVPIRPGVPECPRRLSTSPLQTQFPSELIYASTLSSWRAAIWRQCTIAQ